MKPSARSAIRRWIAASSVSPNSVMQQGGARRAAVSVGVSEDERLPHVAAGVDRVRHARQPGRRAEAVVVERHADVRVIDLAVAGRGAHVELQVRLVERQAPVGSPCRTAAMIRLEKAVSWVWSKPPGGQPDGFGARGPAAARPGLVEDVVAGDVVERGEARRHAPPARGEAVLQAHAVGRRGVRPEVVVGAVERRVAEVALRERLLRVGQPVVDQEPIGEAAAGVAGRELVLVEVDDREDPPRRQQPLRPLERVDVRLVVDARLGLVAAVEEPEPHELEPVARKEARRRPRRSRRSPAAWSRFPGTTAAPWKFTTRPFASVIQRPEWPSGSTGAAEAAGREHERRDEQERQAAHGRSLDLTVDRSESRTDPHRAGARPRASRRRRGGPRHPRGARCGQQLGGHGRRGRPAHLRAADPARHHPRPRRAGRRDHVPTPPPPATSPGSTC